MISNRYVPTYQTTFTPPYHRLQSSEATTNTVTTRAAFTEIPQDLIPINENGYTQTWVHGKYQFYPLFDNEVVLKLSPEARDLYPWMKLANKIQNELKEVGLEGANLEILRIAHDNKMNLPDGQDPISVRDVTEIISTKEWYDNDTARQRHIIYHMMYGIFRVGYNQWAHEVAKKWMDDKKVIYEREPIGKKTKGFIYSLLVHKASDTITKRFQFAMKTNHMEYITVRKKVPKETTVTRHQWGYGHYFVVRVPND